MAVRLLTHQGRSGVTRAPLSGLHPGARTPNSARERRSEAESENGRKHQQADDVQEPHPVRSLGVDQSETVEQVKRSMRLRRSGPPVFRLAHAAHAAMKASP